MLAIWPKRFFFRRKAPRRLKFTRTGRWLIALAFGVGLAALNTGNNLLLLGWSMVLCAIVLSGVLSEGCLRPLRCKLVLTDLWRVGELSTVTFETSNRATTLPSFAVLFTASFVHDQKTSSRRHDVHAPYALRLMPKTQRTLLGTARPLLRGRYRLEELRATTGYPFGFFIKIRPLFHAPRHIVCAPRRVDVHSMVDSLLGGRGDAPQNTTGPSDTLLAIRPYREGDEAQRIDWRRSARAGQPMVRETEQMGGRLVILCCVFDDAAPEAVVEKAIATLGSLAENLLAAQFEVGLLAPGLFLLPSSGSAFFRELLTALALMEPQTKTPSVPAGAQAFAWAHLAGPHLRRPAVATSIPVGLL